MIRPEIFIEDTGANVKSMAWISSPPITLIESASSGLVTPG